MFPAFPGPDDALAADLADKGETHVRDGGAAVQTTLSLHLQDDVLQHFFFILIQVQLSEDQGIALDQLAGGKADRKSHARGVILDQVNDGVNAAVHRAAVIVCAAEILTARPFLMSCQMHCVMDQLVHALILCRGDGDHRNPQLCLHPVDVDGTAVSGHLVHHVQGHHHGNIDLQKLHCEVEIAFDVGGVDDVDNGFGLFVQDEVPGNQFLTGVGGHGVDPGKVRDQGVRMSPDRAVLPVHGDAGKVSHVLIGAGELVEESGLSAVLVSHQGEGQQGPVRQPFSVVGIIRVLFTDSGVCSLPFPWTHPVLHLRSFCHLNIDFFRVGKTQGQFIAVDAQLHRIAQRCQLCHGDLCAGDHAHVQEMLTQGSLAPDRRDHTALARLQVFDRHWSHPLSEKAGSPCHIS